MKVLKVFNSWDRLKLYKKVDEQTLSYQGEEFETNDYNPRIFTNDYEITYKVITSPEDDFLFKGCTFNSVIFDELVTEDLREVVSQNVYIHPTTSQIVFHSTEAHDWTIVKDENGCVIYQGHSGMSDILGDILSHLGISWEHRVEPASNASKRRKQVEDVLKGETCYLN